MTAAALPLHTTCPTWCAGTEQHQPNTYADHEGSHSRRHTRRAGGWVLSDSTVTDYTGATRGERARIEWAPAGAVATANAERAHLETLMDACPSAASPTLRGMQCAADRLGLSLHDWSRRARRGAVDHGRPHRLSDDPSPPRVTSVNPSWRREIGPGSVELVRADRFDEGRQVWSVYVDGDEGFTLDQAREVSAAIAEACALARF